MDEQKIATNEERVQLAKDVLQQLDAGSLCGVPRSSWFVGFPLTDAVPYFNGLHLTIDDLGNHHITEYCSDVGDDDDKEGDEYWTVGARSRRPPSEHGLPEPVAGLDLQEILQAMPTCETCAVGALVVAAAKRHDNMKLQELETEGVFNMMSRYFQKAQLLLIEAVYECYAGLYEDLPREQAAAAIAMWPAVPAGSMRLRLIMENIIANNGTFVCVPTTPFGT